LVLFSLNSSALKGHIPESYGKALNINTGIGYLSYIGNSRPVFHADFEFDMAENFTIAPFINLCSNNKIYYWRNKNSHNLFYCNYMETTVPMGVKGTYYFDQLLGARSDWDFYAAGSLVFAMVDSSFQMKYFGEKNVYHSANPCYFYVHIGAEYHMNNRTGLFLDLSSGVSAFGFAIQL